MNRRELVAATAVVSVLGIAAAAATLESAAFETTGLGTSHIAQTAGGGLGPAAILYVYLAVVLFAAFAILFAIRSDEVTPERLVGLTAVLAVAGVVVVGFLSIGDARITQELLDSLETLGLGTGSAPPDASGGTGAPSAGGGDASGTGGTVLTLALLGTFLALVGAGAVVVGRMLRSPAEEAQAEAESAPADVARAAGRAADHLEDRRLENPVYRAWAEMIESVGVADPETTTPAAFARAAVRAGLDPADVDELTDLFREVRYGDADLTEDRIERATAALRRIEAAQDGDGA